MFFSFFRGLSRYSRLNVLIEALCRLLYRHISPVCCIVYVLDVYYANINNKKHIKSKYTLALASTCMEDRKTVKNISLCPFYVFCRFYSCFVFLLLWPSRFSLSLSLFACLHLSLLLSSASHRFNLAVVFPICICESVHCIIRADYFRAVYRRKFRSPLDSLLVYVHFRFVSLSVLCDTYYI